MLFARPIPRAMDMGIDLCGIIPDGDSDNSSRALRGLPFANNSVDVEVREPEALCSGSCACVFSRVQRMGLMNKVMS